MVSPVTLWRARILLAIFQRARPAGCACVARRSHRFRCVVPRWTSPRGVSSETTGCVAWPARGRPGGRTRLLDLVRGGSSRLLAGHESAGRCRPRSSGSSAAAGVAPAGMLISSRSSGSTRPRGRAAAIARSGSQRSVDDQCRVRLVTDPPAPCSATRAAPSPRRRRAAPDRPSQAPCEGSGWLGDRQSSLLGEVMDLAARAGPASLDEPQRARRSSLPEVNVLVAGLKVDALWRDRAAPRRRARRARCARLPGGGRAGPAAGGSCFANAPATTCGATPGSR